MTRSFRTAGYVASGLVAAVVLATVAPSSNADELYTNSIECGSPVVNPNATCDLFGPAGKVTLSKSVTGTTQTISWQEGQGVVLVKVHVDFSNNTGQDVDPLARTLSTDFSGGRYISRLEVSSQDASATTTTSTTVPTTSTSVATTSTSVATTIASTTTTTSTTTVAPQPVAATPAKTEAADPPAASPATAVRARLALTG